MKKISAVAGGFILPTTWGLSGMLGILLPVTAVVLILYAFWEEFGELTLHAWERHHLKSMKHLKNDLHAKVPGWVVLLHKERAA